MLIFRQKLFALKTKLLTSALIFFGVTVAIFLTAHEAMADSAIYFYFNSAGESPNTYGAEVDSGEWRYVYDFSVESDDSPIVNLEYEIDNNGRQSLSEFSQSGDFDDFIESVRLVIDQRPYADFSAHTITFYATTVAEEESSEQFAFEPYPDPSNPVFYFDTYTEGEVDSTSIPYYFEVNDAFLEEVVLDIDGEPFEAWPYSSYYDYQSYDLNLSSYSGPIDLFDGNEHTFRVWAIDPYGNEGERSYSFTYVEPVEEDYDAPYFSFDLSPDGVTKGTVNYKGRVVDDLSPINFVQYQIDDGDVQYVPIDEEESTSKEKVFDFNIELSSGPHTVTFYAGDNFGNSTSEFFELDVDAESPTCTASWTNLPSPHYTKTLVYSDVTCTDNQPIVDAAYEIYHVVHGILQPYADHHIQPTDENFGGTEETFDFTVDLTEFDDIDGVILVNFKVLDEAGNESADYDPVIIDFTDNTAPTVNLDEVSPDPLTDKTPTITGSCRDATERETNTFISSLEYKVDDGSYQLISLPNDGEYDDSFIESFSIDLAELENGEHTVTVRCEDGAGHSATASDTFEIVDAVDPEPGEYTYTENFEGYENEDIPSSNNVVWGNGKLRLKENITFDRTLVSDTNLCGRYAECRGLWQVWQDPVDDHLVWYYMGNRIYTYNTDTEEVTWFDYTTLYGISQMGGELTGFALGIYEGKKYLWMSDIYSVSVINLTDGTSFHSTDYHDVGSIQLDFARGRLAAYVTTDHPDDNSNVAYLDLNDTFDPGDDVFTRMPLSIFNSDASVGLLLDPDSNALYTGAYGQGILYKINDQNTPSDTSDDEFTTYEDGNYSVVFAGMVLDPEGRLIFGTANNSNGRVFVVEDDGGTPFDSSDDTVIQLASPQQIGYRNVYGIQYIHGENGVGDQLLLNTENDIPVYLNFNDTYENPYDDTFIELDTRAGVRPGGSWVRLTDYNTLYAVNKTQGFYKIDLHRGWKESGQAVGIPTRPPQQLIVDNFVAEANVGGVISYLPAQNSSSFIGELQRKIVPLAQADEGDGIRYYVSTDGGTTWSEVTLGQLQQLQQTDYRVKFKIEMGVVEGATPVLDSYSLSYAGYPSEETVQTTTGLRVSPSATSTTTGGTFSVTVEATDVLGFKTPSYSESVTLSLIDTSTNTVTSGLNVSNASLVDGAITLGGVQINKTGSFKIRATDGSLTSDSNTITVTSGDSLPSPYLGFSASSFKIKKGETVELHWASSYLTSFTLNPGNNQLTAPTGNFYVHPTETTTYTLTGNGPYGSLSHSLTVTVEGEISSPSTSPSPTPDSSTSSTPTPTSSPSTSSPAGSTGSGDQFSATTSGDQTIIRGQKATISWDFPGADEVIINYPEERVVSAKGSFDFFPIDNTQITFKARRGEESLEKNLVVTVLDAPAEVQQVARTVQENFPWATPLLTATLQASKSVPIIGLASAGVLQAGVVGVLLLTIAGQAGLLALLNGRTLLNVIRTAGLLPFKQRKGFTHQTRSGSPVPFATISVYEGVKKAGLPFVTLVSDMYGTYVEPYLPKGEYTFEAAHDAHNFPTKFSRPTHLTLKDFYKGEVLGVVSAKVHQSVLIPMDARNKEDAKNQFKYKLLLMLNRTLHMFSWTVYPLGVLSVFAMWLSPSILNAVVLGIYAILILPRILQLFKKPTLKGRVIVEEGRKPVLNAVVTLSDDAGSVLAITKTDARGNFELFAPHGKYTLNVVSNNLQWNDVKAGTSYSLTISKSTQPLTLRMGKIPDPFAVF